ncbi:MAG: hypothetical protein IAE82_08795 [Opitutaceae bacterium]|nr:hypothetical protein [Opitutaceae bacterium]
MSASSINLIAVERLSDGSVATGNPLDAHQVATFRRRCGQGQFAVRGCGDAKTLMALMPEPGCWVRDLDADRDWCLVRIPSRPNVEPEWLVVREVDHVPVLRSRDDRDFRAPALRTPYRLETVLVGGSGDGHQQDGDELDSRRERGHSPPVPTTGSILFHFLERSGLTVFSGIDLSLESQIGMLLDAAGDDELAAGIPVARHLHFISSQEGLDQAISRLATSSDDWGDQQRNAICFALVTSFDERSINVWPTGWNLPLTGGLRIPGFGNTPGPYLAAFLLSGGSSGDFQPSLAFGIPVVSTASLFPAESDRERVTYAILHNLLRWALSASGPGSLHKPLFEVVPGMPCGGERLDGMLRWGDSLSGIEVLGIRDPNEPDGKRRNYFAEKMAMVERLQRRDGIKIHVFDARPPVGSKAWTKNLRAFLTGVCDWLISVSPEIASPENFWRGMIDSGFV